MWVAPPPLAPPAIPLKRVEPLPPPPPPFAPPSVVAIGTTQCRTIALFYCLLAFSHSVAAICRGAGRAAVPMLVMLVCWCLIRVTYILLIMHVRHEIRFIYMAYPITWTLSSAVYLACLLRLDRIFGTAPERA